MRNKMIIILLFLLCLPVFVVAKDTCNSDDIQIKSITLVESNGFSEEVNQSSIQDNQINLDLKMYDVGDSIDYEIVVENTSNEDYYFTNDSLKIESDHLEYSLKNDHEVIPAKEEKAVELQVVYVNPIQNESYNDVNRVSLYLSNEPFNNPATRTNYFMIAIIVFFLLFITIYAKVSTRKKIFFLALIGILPLWVSASCTVNIQVETNIEIDEKDAIFFAGRVVNTKMKELAGVDPSEVNYNYSDYNISSIQYSNTEPIDSNKEEKNIVSLPESDYPIYMWYEDNTIYWWSEDSHPSLNGDATYMFAYLLQLKDISGVENFDVSNTTDLNAIFYVSGLESTHYLEKWDVSSASQMAAIFSRNSYLNDLSGLKNWDTSSAVNFNQMFMNNTSLTSLEDLREWNTSNLKYISGLFAGATSLTSLDGLEKWDTSSLVTMNGVFSRDSSLVDIEALRNWDVSKAVRTYGLFNGTSIPSLTVLENWDTSSMEIAWNMFCNINTITSLDGLQNWDVSKVTDFSTMFSNDMNLTDTSAINDWHISPDANYENMFWSVPTHPEFSKLSGTWNSEGTFIPES